MAEITSIVYPEKKQKKIYKFLTEEDKRKIIASRGFKSSTELAEEFNVAKPRIYRIWDKTNGVHNGPIYKILIDWIKEMRKEDLSKLEPEIEKDDESVYSMESQSDLSCDTQSLLKGVTEACDLGRKTAFDLGFNNSLFKDFFTLYNFWGDIGDVEKMKKLFREDIARLDGHFVGSYLDPLLNKAEAVQRNLLDRNKFYSDFERLTVKINVINKLICSFSLCLPLLAFFPALYIAEYRRSRGIKGTDSVNILQSSILLNKINTDRRKEVLSNLAKVNEMINKDLEYL